MISQVAKSGPHCGHKKGASEMRRRVPANFRASATSGVASKCLRVVVLVGLLAQSIGSALNEQQQFVPAYQLIQSGADELFSQAAAGPLTLEQLIAPATTLDEQQQQQGRHERTPGHYEFEVAPKMEPPSARRPPFRQTKQLCAGSGPFAGFSPRDTLCGDLNQGKVPLNPLGQFVTDQSYPFELIKNKTLQFLARALPILKLEYDIIPKVARYLPANKLLNPTSHSSPLGYEHFHELNRRVERPQAQLGRNKRSAPLASVNRQASITVAEMAPNATLVVSSAHSSSGRIRSQASLTHELPPSNHLAMITKDGYRSLAAAANDDHQQQQQQRRPQLSVRSATQQPQLEAGENNGRSSGGAENKVAGGGHAQIAHERHTKLHQSSGEQNGNDDQEQPMSRQAQTFAQRNHATQLKLAEMRDEQTAPRNSVNQQAQQAPGGALDGTQNSSQQQQQQRNQQKQSAASKAAQPRRSPCSELGGPFLSTLTQLETLPPKTAIYLYHSVCQTATALIEGEKAPAWVRLLKEVGNLYAGSSSDALIGGSSAASGASSPLWSLWSSLSSSQPAANDRESSSAMEEKKEITTDGQRAASNQAKWTAQSPASPLQTISNIWSLLSPFNGLLAPSLQRDSSGAPASSEAGVVKKVETSADKRQRQTASTMSRLSNYLLATTALAGLVDYFAPSLFGSSSQSLGSLFGLAESAARSSSSPASTFARRKRPSEGSSVLDNLIDTPASLAAMQQRPAISASLVATKQPPTPCPSTEEYISPTFARNYQGAWKYVVQIPHEGYFTQTIQRSSCMRQRCEFTEGVCHEAPRWVSLLVAEIYYPNAVFGSGQQAQPLGGEQQLASAPSSQAVALGAPQQQSGHLRAPTTSGADPLQMTDSLSQYNHNLNNFLGAQALGEQFSGGALEAQAAQFHRSGLHVAEARMAAPAVAAHHQQQQQQQQQQHQATEQQLSNDYIKALAIETLRQNPHLSLDELIKSLQLQTAAAGAAKRKRRDLGQQQQQQSQQQQQRAQFYTQMQPIAQQQMQLNQLAQERALDSSVASFNELSAVAQQQQQQTAVQVEQSQLRQQQTALTSGQPGATTVAADSQSSRAPPPPPTGEQQSPGIQAPPQQQVGQQQQVECDGYDKIGCYVVRVYYDWFLVNGSCKCWKTSAQNQLLGSTTPASASSSPGASGSFIRRIFTG